MGRSGEQGTPPFWSNLTPIENRNVASVVIVITVIHASMSPTSLYDNGGAWKRGLVFICTPAQIRGLLASAPPMWHGINASLLGSSP